LDEIFTVADRVTVIRDGKVVLSISIAETTKSALVQAMLGRQLSSEVSTLSRKAEKEWDRWLSAVT
jgi:ABC-type sugar transport system ATPase subunit